MGIGLIGLEGALTVLGQLLSNRELHRAENYSESTKVVELRNCLKEHEKPFQKLGLVLPLFQNNFPMYLENFSRWILEWTDLLAKGQSGAYTVPKK